MAFGAGPGNILIRVGASTGQAVSELGKLNNALGGSMTKSQRMAATLRKAAVPATIALTAIAVGSKKAIKAASDLNEQANKTEVVFGKSGKSVVAWSRTLAAIQSGLAGQARPLRQYGVFLDAARVKQQALTMGLWDGKGAIDAQAKAAATAAIILKDTADAQGDFARTGESAANQSRIQAAETENLSAALGQGLLPYYQAGQRLLISLTKALSGHTGAVKVAIGVVAGLSAAILAANAAIKAWAVIQTVAKAATIAWAAAQRLLNLALIANPIGLIIAAVAALAIGFVIAYKKSETFRRIVQASIEPLVVIAKALATAFWAVVDAIKAMVSWISKVKVPDIKLPHIPGTRAAGAGYAAAATVGAQATIAGGAAGGVTVNFYGPVDPEGAARAIARVLRAHDVRQGRIPSRMG